MLKAHNITLVFSLLAVSQTYTMHHVTEFTNACEEKNEEKAKKVLKNIPLTTQKLETLRTIVTHATQLYGVPNGCTKDTNVGKKCTQTKKEYAEVKSALHEVDLKIEKTNKEIKENRTSYDKNMDFENKVGNFFDTLCEPTDYAAINFVSLAITLPTIIMPGWILASPSLVYEARLDMSHGKLKERLIELQTKKAILSERSEKLENHVLTQKFLYCRFLRGLITNLMQNKNISCHKCKTVKETSELVLSCDKATCSKLLCKECKATFNTNTCAECCKKTDPREHLLELLNPN